MGADRPRTPPDSATSTDLGLISAEMIAALLSIKIDAARKIISGGLYGKCVKVGKRNLLRREDFDAALLGQQAAVTPRPARPTTSVLPNLPRKRRGDRRRTPKPDAPP